VVRSPYPPLNFCSDIKLWHSDLTRRRRLHHRAGVPGEGRGVALVSKRNNYSHSVQLPPCQDLPVQPSGTSGEATRVAIMGQVRYSLIITPLTWGLGAGGCLSLAWEIFTMSMLSLLNPCGPPPS
jgi:hypothetical protein